MLDKANSDEIVLPTGVKTICVDLDGTLIKSDSLVEHMFKFVSQNVFRIFMVALWMLRGPAVLKQRLAERIGLRVDLFPYNEALIDWLRAEKKRGCKIVLATAANEQVARDVAAHLGLFDDVLASTETHNLKGARKAQALVDRYGEKGFVYVGDSSADLAVWRRAAGAVTVDASSDVRATLTKAAPSLGSFDMPGRSRPRALLKAMRPYQWVKNILVAVPVVASGSIAVAGDWAAAGLAFVAFSMAASGVYLLNDASDLEADRIHPRKRARPFASGDLPLPYAVLGLALFAGALGVSTLAGFAFVTALYIVVSMSYSLFLKRFALFDVFFLTSLFVIRIFAGSVATDHLMSTWLLAFSAFFFLSLALMKRATEILVTTESSLSARGYVKADELLVVISGIASAFMASVVLALYLEADESRLLYGDSVIVWGLVPTILLWQMRLWRITLNGRMTDDPIVFAAKDVGSWLLAFIGLCFVAVPQLLQ